MSTVNFENLHPGAARETESSETKEDRSLTVDIRGGVEVRKKNFFQRTISSIKHRDLSSIIDDIWESVIKPYAQDMAADAGNRFIESIVYDDYISPRGRYGRSTVSSDGSIPYNTFFKGGSNNGKRIRNAVREAPSKGSISYDEFIFKDKMDVQDILDSLIDEASEYEVASIAVLYSTMKEILKKQGYDRAVIEALKDAQYTDNKIGWTKDQLIGVVPGRVRGGFILDLPRAKFID